MYSLELDWPWFTCRLVFSGRAVVTLKFGMAVQVPVVRWLLIFWVGLAVNSPYSHPCYSFCLRVCAADFRAVLQCVCAVDMVRHKGILGSPGSERQPDST